VGSIFNRIVLSTEVARGLAIHVGTHHIMRLASELLSHELDSPVLGIVTLLYGALVALDLVSRIRA
jgi:hypothetical protein